MFTCEAVDLDYIDIAPIHLHASINVNRPPSEVFAALAHDPANWASSFRASTELAVSIRRRRMALALATRSGLSASRLTNRYSSGMKALVLPSVSIPQPRRRFTPGLRTTAASLTATAALCCESTSAASRDSPSNWQRLCCSQYSHA